MSRKEDYVKFWNSYIDYCVGKGSTIFTLEDKIPEGKLIDHSKTKSFGYLKIDLNANQKLGKVNLYTIRVENYINIPKQPELNKKIFAVLKNHEAEIRSQLSALGWDIIFYEPEDKQNRKIYIPGKDLQYTGECDIKLFDFFHRASEDLYKVLRPIYDSMSFL